MSRVKCSCCQREFEPGERQTKPKEHRIVCGDSTDPQVIAKALGGRLADCVFTSPPYAVGVDYGAYQDTIENLRAMLPQMAQTWLGAVVPGGFAVINFGDIVAGREISGADEPCEYPMALEYFPEFRAAGWTLWSRRVAVKPIFATAAFWTAQTNRASVNWEHVWTWKKPGAAIVAHTDESASGIWGYAWKEGVAEKKETHGAGMGTDWALLAVAIHSRRGGIVLEPFLGTGTSLVACETKGRVGAGIDLEPKFVAIALQRMEDLGLEVRRAD